MPMINRSLSTNSGAHQSFSTLSTLILFTAISFTIVPINLIPLYKGSYFFGTDDLASILFIISYLIHVLDFTIAKKKLKITKLEVSWITLIVIFIGLTLCHALLGLSLGKTGTSQLKWFGKLLTFGGVIWLKRRASIPLSSILTFLSLMIILLNGLAVANILYPSVSRFILKTGLARLGYTRLPYSGGALIPRLEPPMLGGLTYASLLILAILWLSQLSVNCVGIGKRFLLFLGAMVCLAFLAATFSRNALGGFLFASLMLLIVDREIRRTLLRPSLVLLVAIGLLTVILVVSQTNLWLYWYRPSITYLKNANQYTAITGRVELWRIGFSEFLERPLIGHGKVSMSNPKLTVNIFHSHNTFINMLVFWGLLGAIPFLMFWITAFRYLLWKILIKHSNSEIIMGLRVSFVWLCSLFVMGIFDDPFFLNRGGFGAALLILGIAYSSV